MSGSGVREGSDGSPQDTVAFPGQSLRAGKSPQHGFFSGTDARNAKRPRKDPASGPRNSNSQGESYG